MRPLALALAAAPLLALGCSSNSDPAGSGGAAGHAGQAGAGGAAGGAEEDGGAVCAASGISKRPWVQRVDGTSALMRWESCREGTSGEVTFTAPGGASSTVQATESPFVIDNRYTAPLNLDAPADEPGTYYMKEARLTGLTPGVCYTYALTADASATGRFCTSPPSGTPFHFQAIGDTNPGLAKAPQALLEITKSEPSDFLLHAGDLQYYASGMDTWAYWFRELAPMLSRGAFLPCIGNHEYEKPDEYEQYYHRLFGNAGFDGTDAYYRFEHGGVYFFALDTEQGIAENSPQHRWVTQQLADAKGRPGFRFSVVFFHKPFLTCGDTGQNDAARNLLTPAFEANDVRLVIQGHMHGYERFVVPMTSAPSKTITYVTAGGGGGALGNIDENIARAECALRAKRAKSYNIVLFEVTASGINGKAVDRKGEVIDSFTQALD